MTDDAPTLHMICGKIAAGKSTLAKQLADRPHAVLISEDRWLSGLFGPEMSTVKDYAAYTARLRATLGPHIEDLLANGLTVVLDFSANTVEQRRWMHTLIDETGCAHVLHVLNPPDDVCRARLHARNAEGTHPFQVTDAQFHQVSKHFALPMPEEGFHMQHYDTAF